MVAIFCMGVFSLGMQSSRLDELLAQLHMTRDAPAPEKAQNKPPERASQDDKETKQTIPSVQIQLGKAPTASPTTGASLDAVSESPDKLLARIGFEAQSVAIDEAARVNLQALHVKLQAIKTQTHKYVVWGAVNTRDTEQRRAVFLRVMTVRDWLISEGIEPAAIETRLLSGLTNRQSGQNIFVLIDLRTE
jgi:hypothetical protein